MSLALARATIAPRLPPSEWETYQTHIPWRSKAVSLTLPPVSTSPAPPVSAFAAGASRQAARAAATASSAGALRLLWGWWLTTGLNTVVGAGVRTGGEPGRVTLSRHHSPVARG